MITDEREKLKLQLMRNEGIRLKPYVDTVGKVTIGVGRNLTDRGLSHDECLFLLENDCNLAIRDAMTFTWFDDLDVVRQRAVVDLIFNLGLTRWRGFTQTIAALAAKNYTKAAALLRKSLWFRQVKSRGPRIVHMIETGTDPL